MSTASTIGFDASPEPSVATPSTVVAPVANRIKVAGPAMVWRVLALAATIGVYLLYRLLRVGAGRDVFHRGLPVEPFRNAVSVLNVERAFWLDIEQGVQDVFLSHGLFIRFANGYYSWSHQVFTLGLVALVLLKAPWRQARRWVAGLLMLLPLGLVCFKLYPLMPPRLLDAGAPWGGRILETHRNIRPTGIVDTLVKFAGPWTPDPVALNGFTNQYAAMPSLHCAFSMWVGVVWWRWAKGKSWRFVGPAHALFMAFCTVVTGNHFVLDIFAGWALVFLTLAISTGRARRWWRMARGPFLREGDGDRQPISRLDRPAMAERLNRTYR